jgi:hypothetical protein
MLGGEQNKRSQINFGCAAYAPGCAANAVGCAAYAVGSAEYALSCAAYAVGCAAYVCHSENIDNSVQLN